MASAEYYPNHMAEYYATWHTDRIRDLCVLPPYEPRDRQSQWVRGAIRHRLYDDNLRDLVVTGPKLKICFSGCNYRRIVFSMDESKPDVYGFQQWLLILASHVKDTIWMDPGKYKNGAISSSRFTFDEDFIKPANDPSRYPDELRCKLSTKRELGPDNIPIEVVDADLFMQSSNGEEVPINSEEITAGSYMIPIIKFSYYRNGERFGMNMTVLKGLVFPAEKRIYDIDNRSWVIDHPNPN